MRWIDDAKLREEIELEQRIDSEPTTVADFMTALKAEMGFVEDPGPKH